MEISADAKIMLLEIGAIVPLQLIKRIRHGIFEIYTVVLYKIIRALQILNLQQIAHI
jgi:hypothetical protein